MANQSEIVAALGEWSTASGPLYRRLASALRRAIERGELGAGQRLPPERSLALLLSVSRSTVVTAYDELRDQGVLRSRQGSGTFVPTGEQPLWRGARPPLVVQSAAMSGLDSGARGGLDIAVADEREIIELAVAAPPGIDVITPETLAAAASDVAELIRAHGYVPLGLPALRDAVAAHLSRAGLPTRRGQVLITSGAQQAIGLSIALFVRPGDSALIENPTWAGAMDALRAAGANLIAVPVDSAGARIDTMRELLSRSSPRLAYVCPTFQNPTGVVMPADRRRELARLAIDRGLPLLDDNALADLSLGAMPPPPVAAFASSTADRDAAPILTIGSMSKLFWGGLRVGWIRAPEALIDRLARLKVVADHGSSLVSQVLALRLLEQVDEAKAIRRRQGLERMELLRALIAERLPGWTSNQPAGGHLLWVRLPRGDAAEFSQMALRHGVAVVAGSVSSPDGSMTDWLRIPFVLERPALTEGVRRLAEAWERYSASLSSREPVKVVL